MCTLDGDLYPPLEEPTGTVDSKTKKKDKDKDKKFIWNHGSKFLLPVLKCAGKGHNIDITDASDVAKASHIVDSSDFYLTFL